VEMEPYRVVEIYHFSGTGNCLTATGWIGAKASAYGSKVSLIPIDNGHKPLVASELLTLTGFCYPAHGFSLSWYMLKFIARFPRARKGRGNVFLLNTRAGMKLYKLFTPGLSGLAFILPLLILRFKGYRVKGILPLDMPSNWISIHPGLRKKVSDSITDWCEGIVSRFADKLLAGRTAIQPIFWVMLPVDILVSPVSICYFVVGRYFLAKTFFASAKCNDCRLCEEKCPVGAIRIVNNRPYWRFRCESCMRCMNICPQKTINTAHLLAFGLIWGVSLLPFFPNILQWIANLLPMAYTTIPGLFDLTVWTIVCLPFFWGLYHVFHQITRVKPINRLFTYTSLTFYWRRYIARGVKASSFKVPRDEA